MKQRTLFLMLVIGATSFLSGCESKAVPKRSKKQVVKQGPGIGEQESSRSGRPQSQEVDYDDFRLQLATVFVAEYVRGSEQDLKRILTSLSPATKRIVESEFSNIKHAITKFDSETNSRNWDRVKDSIASFRQAVASLEDLSIQQASRLYALADGMHSFAEECVKATNAVPPLGTQNTLAVAHRVKGNLALYENKPRQAIQHFSAAIMADSSDAEAYDGRARAYTELEQYPQAIADYSQAILWEPRNADLYYWRGLVKALLNQDRAAVADLTKAIELKSDYAAAYSARGMCKSKLGLDSAAREDLEKALSLGDLTAKIGLKLLDSQ